MSDQRIDPQEREAMERWIKGVAVQAMSTVPSELLSVGERIRLKATWRAGREYSKQHTTVERAS
jgi:hypothetical protein